MLSTAVASPCQTLCELLVEFMCELPNAAYDFVWLINAHEFGPELGIILVRENNRTFAVVGIDPRVENNNTRLLCLASFLGTSPLMSAEVTVNPEILARHKI